MNKIKLHLFNKCFIFLSTSGDDDINDVAAMGGVNLAEETQRILGSTDFVGTQIRSCKDEILLPQNSLIAKIKHIGNYDYVLKLYIQYFYLYYLFILCINYKFYFTKIINYKCHKC